MHATKLIDSELEQNMCSENVKMMRKSGLTKMVILHFEWSVVQKVEIFCGRYGKSESTGYVSYVIRPLACLRDNVSAGKYILI